MKEFKLTRNHNRMRLNYALFYAENNLDFKKIINIPDVMQPNFV